MAAKIDMDHDSFLKDTSNYLSEVGCVNSKFSERGMKSG
jgi:hypothetical protein